MRHILDALNNLNETELLRLCEYMSIPHDTMDKSTKGKFASAVYNYIKVRSHRIQELTTLLTTTFDMPISPSPKELEVEGTSPNFR